MTGSQPTVCMICTVVPTITTSTHVTITPVSMSIFFCGSLRSRPNTAKPTSTVAPMPISTPSSTVATSVASTSACTNSTVSKPSR